MLTGREQALTGQKQALTGQKQESTTQEEALKSQENALTGLEICSCQVCSPELGWDNQQNWYLSDTSLVLMFMNML